MADKLLLEKPLGIAKLILWMRFKKLKNISLILNIFMLRKRGCNKCFHGAGLIILLVASGTNGSSGVSYEPIVGWAAIYYRYIKTTTR